MSRTAKEQEAYDQGALDALAALRSQMELKRTNAQKGLTDKLTDRFKGYSFAVDDVIHMVTETRLSIIMRERRKARESVVHTTAL